MQGHPRPLLPVAALYGANASGKSNMLSALGFMRDAVVDSHPSWPAPGGVPRDAFAWGDRSRAPSTYEATFLVDGVRVRYGFAVDGVRVLEEWLFAWPKGRRHTWLERDGDRFAFGAHLSGENRVVEQVTRPNALFLSAAAQHKHEQPLPVYTWFRRLATVRIEGYRERYGDAMPAALAAAVFAAAAAAAAASAAATGALVRVRDLIPEHGRRGESLGTDGVLEEIAPGALRAFLAAADVGVSDFRIEAAQGGTNDVRRVFMRHDAGQDDAWLPLEQESAGTRALFHLAPAIIEILGRGGLLLIDELEASLHPLVAAQVVRQFNDPRTNPRHAQLVFATHDTRLFGTSEGAPSLRRDQIWLTEKDAGGSTVVFPLTDYKPRKAENIERGYLQGRYGALPFVGGFGRLRARP